MPPKRLPTIAIVGRPNVGKSTLFNRILNRRIAIVEDVPGVTRDRIYGDGTWQGRDFTVVDTGGLVDESADDVLTFIREQAVAAMAASDVLIFMTDQQVGPTPADEEVAEMVRRLGKPVLVAANKVDHPSHEAAAPEFYQLALGEVFPVSAIHGVGVAELLDAALELLPEATAEEEEGHLAIAIVGRPNVGKSSLINALLGERRVMVRDEPGTTRDAIDVDYVWDGREYTLIDTAGLRKKAGITDAVEKHSTNRAVQAIERCDVAVLLMDAGDGLVEQDLRLANLVHRRGRGLIVALNKWDLVEKTSNTLAEIQKDYAGRYPVFGHVPFLAISVHDRQRLHSIFDAADTVAKNCHWRVSTSQFNQWLEDWTMRQHPPMYKKKPVRIKYGTQTGSNPPTITLFANRSQGVVPAYLRYLENCLRREEPLVGAPIRWNVRSSGSSARAATDA